MTGDVEVLDPGELLTPEETARLEDAEKAIEQGLATFYDVGRALAAISDGRLYRATHDTFEAYARERWQLGKSYAYEQIASAKAIEEVSLIADTSAITNPSQAKALAKVARVHGPEGAAEVLSGLPAGGRITAQAIGRAAARRFPTDRWAERQRQAAERRKRDAGRRREAAAARYRDTADQISKAADWAKDATPTKSQREDAADLARAVAELHDITRKWVTE
jgi:hypothetical protein